MAPLRTVASLQLPLALPGCSEQGLSPKHEAPSACSDEPVTSWTSLEAACHVEVEPTPVEDPWAVDVLWEWEDPSLGHLTAPPLVGYLLDTNGDGSQGGGDTPVVVVSAIEAVAALDGATGRELWRWERPSEWLFDTAGLALADVDGDGISEVVTVAAEGETGEWALWVIALDGRDGRERWRGDAGNWTDNYAVPLHVADLAGDGVPEVIVSRSVLSGADGSLRATLDTSWHEWSVAPNIVTADLDGDGTQEILTRAVVFNADGGRLWDARLDGVGGQAHPVVLQADEDPEPEVAWLYDKYLSVWESEGSHSAGLRPQPNGAPPRTPLGPGAPDPERGLM